MRAFRLGCKAYIWFACLTLCASKKTYMICGGHVVTASLIARHLAPPHACHNYVMLAQKSLLLPWFVFAAGLCIPLHPSEPILALLSPLSPLFVCAHIHVFFGKFHGHACHTNIHCTVILVLFSLVFPYFRVVVPHRTHLHPSAPICTRPHPPTLDVYHYMCFSYLNVM